MCRSCLQCWVSDQVWDTRAYCFSDMSGPLAMDSKSSGDTFCADVQETKGCGLGITEL